MPVTTFDRHGQPVATEPEADLAALKAAMDEARDTVNSRPGLLPGEDAPQPQAP